MFRTPRLGLFASPGPPRPPHFARGRGPKAGGASASPTLAPGCCLPHLEAELRGAPGQVRIQEMGEPLAEHPWGKGGSVRAQSGALGLVGDAQLVAQSTFCPELLMPLDHAGLAARGRGWGAGVSAGWILAGGEAIRRLTLLPSVPSPQGAAGAADGVPEERAEAQTAGGAGEYGRWARACPLVLPLPLPPDLPAGAEGRETFSRAPSSTSFPLDLQLRPLRQLLTQLGLGRS